VFDWANLPMDDSGKGIIQLGSVKLRLNGISVIDDTPVLYDEKGRSVTASEDGGLIALHDLVIKGTECYVKTGGSCFKIDQSKEKLTKLKHKVT